ncbi:pirin family protein [Vreelandella salicampi]|uniref:Pirin family protein n=1 Tax=Vreelandella salicampi TaxID=1449798 RepID=A0A7Z0LJW3_9GAMM|nr:pirin family protein [Halomonas salicampi]NYS60272.1 pirin family protein [Halomonas salicampi]
MNSRQRTIDRRIPAHPSQDGDGVKIKRIHEFGGGIDPFLMLDELAADTDDAHIGGFPPHPHRGIQTLTYVIHGGLTHEDHLGHRSTIHPGDAQWMHTGRGMVHSEMPLTDENGLLAFQLWLNLPAKEKMSTPTYRDVRHVEMPTLTTASGTLVALGGHWQTLAGECISGPLDALAGHGGVSHLTLAANGEIELTQTATTLCAYVFRGELTCAGEAARAGELIRFSAGEILTLKTANGAQALLLAGEPHHEPIAHYGPFVMNTRHELDQALRDYRDGTFTHLPAIH